MSGLHNTRAYWSGVLAMTLCVFVLIASEFMPVSLLTPIAGDLHITEGLAGQGIALSGALAVLTSLTISRLTGSLDRKWLLLGLTALMAASGLMIALASSFPVYMLGSYLGATVGWRGAFLCLVPLAMVAFIWQCVSLPSMKSQRAPQRQGTVLRLFRRSTVSLGLLACGLFFMGQFTLFTYVRPFLETVTRVSSSGLPLILLAIGVAGFVGTLLISTVLHARFYPTLVAIPLIMAAIVGALLLAGHHTGAVTVLLSLWGLLATAAPTGWWTWIARTLPEDAEAGGGLMVAVIQLSIALGSTAGGLVFDSLGWHSTFALSGLLLLGAAGGTFLLSVKIRSSQRTAINELNA